MTSSQKSQLRQGGAYSFPATITALSDDSLVTHTDLSALIRGTVMQVLQDGRRILASGMTDGHGLFCSLWDSVSGTALAMSVPRGRSCGWRVTCGETGDGSRSGVLFFGGSSTWRPYVQFCFYENLLQYTH